MKEQKELFLCQAHSHASRAGARCKVLAMKAGHEGHVELEAYLRAASESYQIQARRLLLLLRGKIEPAMAQVLADLEEELALEAEELKAMRDKSAELGDGALNAALGQAEQVLESRQTFFQTAKEADDSEGDYLVCQICGCLVKGEAPDNCPVCQAVKDKFQKV